MVNKDEIVDLVAQTVFDFAKISDIQWDGIYFRFYSANQNHASFEFSYKNQRELNPIRGNLEYSEILKKLMTALYEIAAQETGVRPLVAVVEVRADQKYSINFSYEDPNALDISLTALGTSKSFFANGAIDIPEVVRELQRDLAKNGLSEMPVFYDQHTERPV
jgi:hypothetical protein